MVMDVNTGSAVSSRTRQSPVGCSAVGLGLRPAHIQTVLRNKPNVAWFEVHVCNYLGGGMSRALLYQVAEHYPISLHGVSLNLGGVDELDKGYLAALKCVVDDIDPMLVSEHACFTAHQGQHFHDLLPIPFTEDALQHMADRVDQVQNSIGRTLLLENVSRYTSYSASSMSEGEFLARLCQMTGCKLILDLNNAYVNQQNLNEAVGDFLKALPLANVAEIHLAGHGEYQDQLIDTHAAPVGEAVWQLYRSLLLEQKDMLNVPCLIEWDNDLPEFSVLQAEAMKATQLRDEVKQYVSA